MNPSSPLLTEAELELMLILWRLGEGTVREVLEEVSKQRPMAYTTASTIIRILEKKGYVASRKQGKAHIYRPTVEKDIYEARTLGHMVGKLFNRSPASLVARLVDNDTLSAEEIEQIRQLLDKRR